MKLKLTLKMRITALVGVLLTFLAVLLTIFSIYGNNRHFVRPLISAAAVLPILDNTDTIPFDQVPMDKVDISTSVPPSSSVPMGMITDGVISAITITQAQRNFSGELILALGLIVISGVVLTYFLAGRALKPLTLLSQTAEGIDRHNLHTTLPVSPSKDEISSLTASFNSMLSRLDQAFAVQKSFSANAAHELKTPLAIMKTSLQVLELDTPTIEEYQESNRVLEKNIDRLNEILNGLLDLAQCDNLSNHALSLDALVRSCLIGLESQLDARDLAYSIVTCPVEVVGNEALLFSAVENILTNAIKYNRQGGRVDVMVTKGGNTAQVCVQDTGTGISNDSLPHIFEPFYRADPSRSKAILGNGLGLSITQTVMKQLGGSITVTSTPNVGTTATLTFPL